MADTKISSLTDGTTAAGTDRIPAARSPFGTGTNRYITPAYIAEYIRTLTQTLTNKTLTSPILTTPTLGGWTIDGSDTLTGPSNGLAIVKGGLEAYKSSASADGVVIGNNAGAYDTSDSINIGFFAGAGDLSNGAPSGSQAIRIGRHAGYTSAAGNSVIIGHAACQYTGGTVASGSDVSSAVVIGPYACRNDLFNAPFYAYQSVILGYSAGQNGTSLQTSILLGANAGKNVVGGVGAVAIGWNAAASATQAGNAVIIGNDAGSSSTAAVNCVYIGNEAGKTLNRSNSLVIDGNTTYSNGSGALIYGEFDNRTLTINGTVTGTSFTATGTLHAYSGTSIPAGGTTGSGIKVSSTSNFGVFFGSGAPTLSAAQGSIYLRSDGTSTTGVYTNTNGSTTWAAIGGGGGGTPGGSSGQLQYNNAGSFGGASGITLTAGALSALSPAGGTVTASAPLFAGTQTWNNGAVTFIGAEVAVTNTASAAASLLLNLKVGTVNRFAFRVDGQFDINTSATDYVRLDASGQMYKYMDSLGISTRLMFDDGGGSGTGSGLWMGANGLLRWQSLNRTDGGSTDLSVHREAAGVLSLRGGTTTTPGAMSFYTYGASPPAAPSASIARLYADTSGGKIRLMVIFPSGAAQQIAIEP